MPNSLIRSYPQPCTNTELGVKGNQWLSLLQTVDAKKEMIFSPNLLIALRRHERVNRWTVHVDRVQVNYPLRPRFYYVHSCLLLTRCDWKQVPLVTADGLALDSDKPYAVTRLFSPLPGHSELTAASSLFELWTVLRETAWIYHISHTVT